MRSDWLFPICTGGERLKDDDGDKAHPTQKPEALLHRVLMAATKPGDVVLDPVLRHRHDRRGRASGSAATSSASSASTTYAAIAAQAHRRGRRRSPPRTSRRRAQASAASRASRSARWSRRACCEPGTVLDRRRAAAIARRCAPTARLGRCADAHRGSIHQVGAAVQGAPACNGWTFWHIEVEGARRRSIICASRCGRGFSSRGRPAGATPISGGTSVRI